MLWDLNVIYYTFLVVFFLSCSQSSVWSLHRHIILMMREIMTEGVGEDEKRERERERNKRQLERKKERKKEREMEAGCVEANVLLPCSAKKPFSRLALTCLMNFTQHCIASLWPPHMCQCALLLPPSPPCSVEIRPSSVCLL